MRLLRYADLVATPWKNGGGVTREILSEPGTVGPGDFVWRVSIATVGQSGPFSVFSGIDRTITVLAGKGMRLEAPDEVVDLTMATPPYRFSGDVPIMASVIDGPTIDLNVMTRRGSARHEVERHQPSSESMLRTTAETSLIVFTGSANIACGGDHLEAGPFDALVGLTAGTAVEVAATNHDPCYLIGLDR